MMLKLAHLSDLHYTLPTWNPSQFLSKQWIGTANWVLFREKEYSQKHFEKLAHFLHANGIEKLGITGDFVTTAREKEFERAHAFLNKAGFDYLFVPGNHDYYTKDAEKMRLFYRSFPDQDLETKRVTLKPLKGKWWWIGLDCALATPPFNDYGLFFPEMENFLLEALKSIPSDCHVIVAGHFPLYTIKNEHHGLKRKEKLIDILKQFPQVKLYIHGHDHNPRFETLHHFHTLCSGSVAKSTLAPFSILELKDWDLRIERYEMNLNTSWSKIEERSINF